MSRRRWSGGARAGALLIAILGAVALLSPLLATDLPLAVRADDGLSFPALRAWGAALFDRPVVTSVPAGSWALSAPIPYSPNRTNLRERLEPPSRKHPLGTDELGRDLLARIVHGSRVSLLVGVSAALFSLLIGVTLGSLAGFFGGWVDALVLRSIETVSAFPFLVLLLAIVSVLRPGVATIILALAITTWTAEARLVRGEMLRVRESAFAVAARASGGGWVRIVTRHLLPNAIAPALVSTSFGVSAAILLESAISFLGFGVPLPRASWGSILGSADEYLARAWWLAVFPGLAIFLTVAACNAIGEGVRQRLDPKGVPSS